MNDRLGLKGLWKETKGMYPIPRLKKLWRELKFAWQRAYRGWDNTCVWDIDWTLRAYLVEWLQEYKNHHECLWWCPEGYEVGTYMEQFDRFQLNEEQINVILDTLIFHFQMADEDYCEKVLYGKCIYDDDYDFSKKTTADYHRIYAIRKQNQDLGMDLLKLVMDQLWD